METPRHSANDNWPVKPAADTERALCELSDRLSRSRPIREARRQLGLGDHLEGAGPGLGMDLGDD